jgi:ABC-2 type transport system permease protein
MTATTSGTRATDPGSSLSNAVADGLVVTWRNLKRIPRIPELAIFAILQSIMFVLLFAFVFGGAIDVPGADYTSYLMPGIFVQTLTFATVTTAIGMAEDMNKGLIDRFRSLPMARSAVLSGRTTSDVVYNCLILFVLMATGLLVGWRVESGVFGFLAALGLMLVFAYAMSWLGVLLGLMVPTVEVAQQVGFIVLFPLTFVSNAFVPLDTMPPWLETLANWNPISAIVAACRELFGNATVPVNDSFPMQHPELMSMLWIGLALLVFPPLAVRKYREAASR